MVLCRSLSDLTCTSTAVLVDIPSTTRSTLAISRGQGLVVREQNLCAGVKYLCFATSPVFAGILFGVLLFPRLARRRGTSKALFHPDPLAFQDILDRLLVFGQGPYQGLLVRSIFPKAHEGKGRTRKQRYAVLSSARLTHVVLDTNLLKDLFVRA